MKEYIYKVAEYTYTDTEAFGQAWRDAKAKARELHAPIYRTIVETREEVYTTAGAFLNTKYADPDRIERF
jgi:hypothetical protein